MRTDQHVSNKALPARTCRCAGCPARPIGGDVYCRKHKPTPPPYASLHPVPKFTADDYARLEGREPRSGGTNE